jgi:farnesyl-diphosphate farnesyltransferase
VIGPVTTRALDPILRRVSRSIFLTLQVAPAATRRQLGVAYLFCRAADTIADTRLLPPAARLAALERFRAPFTDGATDASAAARVIAAGVGEAQAIPEERDLLARLDECFAAYAGFAGGDQERIRKLVTTLTQGMAMDLERFPAEESGETAALESDADLDLYTYYVAGCVGEFWTDLHAANVAALGRWDLPARREQGVRFGKGLQLTNVLRDAPADLAIGRCYFPRARLAPLGLSAADLRAGRGRERLAPLLREYLALALAHHRTGWEYTLAVPRRCPRLRLACAWPLLIGLRTLALIARAPDPSAPGTVLKVSRPEVKAILRRSAARVFSDRALGRLYGELEAEVGAGTG